MEARIPSLEQVSAEIRAARKAAGMSQKRLARACGLSQSTIARMETGISELNPSYRSVFYVIEALGSGPAGRHRMMGRSAQEIMHRRIIYVKPDTSVLDAVEVFKDYDFPQLPVLDSSRHVVGTVYQKDLLNAATQNPELVRRRRVASIMRASLPQVDRGSEIAGLKPALEVSGAVVVVDGGRAVGIITIYDMLKTV